MNTRLQVEHPISECITGVDIVQEMIRVAYGHSLKFKQSDIPINGWALEMRVYAEDATRGFGTPSTGRLFRYMEPKGEGIRCDTGVREGSEISVYYDAMICKLVSYGATRKEAIEIGKTALDSYVIQGVQHNIPLLRDILSEESYVNGETDTSYLPRVYPDGFHSPKLSEHNNETLKAVAAVLEACRNLRLNKDVSSFEFVVSDTDGNTTPLTITVLKDQFEINLGKRTMTFPRWDLGQTIVGLNVDGENLILQIHGRGNGPNWKIGFQGASYEFRLLTPYVQTLLEIMPKPKASDTAKELLSPMPGVVHSVLVKVGDKVFKGQEVCTIEAMKMQNKLVIGADGIVHEVNVKEGDSVSEDDILIALK